MKVLVYCEHSNGKIKTDVSSPCTNIVNRTQRSRLVVYNCPGKKGGKAPPLVREAASEEPKPEAEQKPEQKPEPKPEPKKDDPPNGPAGNTASDSPPSPEAPAKPAEAADSCQWFAMALCNRSQAETLSDQRRLGLNGTQLIRTSDYSNMAGGWYCLGSPAASQADANAKARSFRGRSLSSYPSKGCR